MTRDARGIIVGLVLIMVAVLAIWIIMDGQGQQLGEQGNELSGNDNNISTLTVHFIDVGQGDATFIDYGDYDILIDAGDNDSGKTVVDYLQRLDTDDIEIVIATHPHADHIGGLDDVLYAFEVEKVIDCGLDYDSKTYRDYLDAVEEETAAGTEFMYDDDMCFELGDGIIFEVIETGDDHEDTNNNTILTKLVHGQVEFLFTGDMESDVEDTILDRNLAADILKVGHHGSHTSTSDAFLDVVRPEVAIISAGLDNRYGHPHSETLQRLEARNVEIYGTWEQGTIVVTTDGSTYEINAVR